MTGVVLCGGESTRMTTDKGLLKLNTNTWTQIALDRLETFRIPVVISINNGQHAVYKSVFSSDILVVDDNFLQIRGPLRGLLSVHLKYPDEDLAVIACDMPLMETSVITELLTQYHQQKSFDAFVYKNDEEFEPLCGIYKANSLSKILGLYKSNQLVKHSMKYILEQMNTYSIPLSEDKKKCFRNFNTKEELNTL